MDGALDAEGSAATAGQDDTFGEEEQAGAGFEDLDGGLVGEVGEEAEGHTGVGEDAGAVGVAEDGGLAAGVDVGEDAEGLVVAGEEGGGEADAGGAGGEGVVDVVGEDGDGVGEIGGGGAESSGTRRRKVSWVAAAVVWAMARVPAMSVRRKTTWGPRARASKKSPPVRAAK